MKSLGLGLILLCVVALGYQVEQLIMSDYQFEKQYLYAWNLADKSSTIDAKSKYIAQFVEKLETNKIDFSEYNAVWLKTPDNSFEMNLSALKTLNSRLNEIQKMDVKSFEYQTAIQQITAQEQGEAHNLIRVIRGCWNKENYAVVWGWYGFLWCIFFLITIIVGLIVLAVSCDY